MDAREFRDVFPRLATDLDDEEVSRLLRALTPRSFAAGTNLCTFGEVADTLHLITSGELAIRVTAAGETLYFGHAGRGGTIGEVGFIEPGTASATVEALEAVSALSLDHQGLERLCRTDPPVASALLLALSLELARRVRRSSTDIVRRIDDHAWMRAEARRDRTGWVSRLAALVHGSDQGAA